MKAKKQYLATGALLCTSVVGALCPTLSTYATFNNSADGSSYFDFNAQACVVEGYNLENHTSITSIEEIDPSKITTLDCSNRNIENFKGVTILTSLKTLNISGNSELATGGQNFLTPASLETINVSGIDSTYYDFSNSPKLTTITTDRDLFLRTSTYIEKLSADEEYAYGMKLGGLKFLNSAAPSIDETNYPAKYNQDTKTIVYKNKIPEYNVSVKVGNYTYRINTRSGKMQTLLYFKGEKPQEIKSRCEEREYEENGSEGSHAYCSNVVYYGDTIDTEAFLKKFNLSDYTVSKIEVVPPNANIKLTTNEDTVKKGIVGADANFTLKFYFDESDLGVPNTGIFTAGNTTAIATTAVTAITVAGIAIYLSRSATMRQKAKIRFNKK